MKKLLSVAALALLCTVVPPTPGFADPAQSTTVTGNTINQGAVTAYNLNPAFVGFSGTTGTIQAFTAAGLSNGPFLFNLSTDQSFNALLQNPPLNTTGDAKILIRGFSVACAPYNPVIAAAPPGNYPYVTETNGIAGGTITVEEFKLVGAVVTVGTLVLPTSPHGGPYVDTATSVLPAPYTPTAGSVFTAFVSAFNPTPSQGYQNCNVTAVLQEALKQSPGS